jgi:hypothetical protein
MFEILKAKLRNDPNIVFPLIRTSIKDYNEISHFQKAWEMEYFNYRDFPVNRAINPLDSCGCKNAT